MCVEGGGAIGVRAGNVEAAEGNGPAGRSPAMPGDSHTPGAQGWNADAVVSRRIDLEEWLLANDRGFANLGIRRRRPLSIRRVGNADEHHVPIGATPTAPFGVSGNPLLLWTCTDVAVNQVVGHPAAA